MRSFLRAGPLYKLADLLTSARSVVDGDSMQPGLAGGQYVLVSRMAFRRCGPSRGDLVVMRQPGEPERDYIKRVVGLPGECVRVESGGVFINDCQLEEPYLGLERDTGAGRGGNGMSSKEWAVGDDSYFVMGDNRANSDDSRLFGPLKRDLIIGKVWIRYWPRSAWGTLG